MLLRGGGNPKLLKSAISLWREALKNEEVSIDCQDFFGNTPLIIVLKWGKRQLALLRDDTSNDGIQAIKQVKSNCAECLKLLVENNASVLAKNGKGKCAADYALQARELKWLDALIIMSHESLSDPLWRKLTEDYLVSWFEQIELLLPVQVLALQAHKESCFNIEQCLRPLLYAKKVTLFIPGSVTLRASAYAVERHAVELHDVLFFFKACEEGYNTAIKELLSKNNSYIKYANEKGFMPLHLAARGGHVDTVNLLIEQGAEINAQIFDFGTALHLACEYGHSDVVRRLLKAGANINVKMQEGRNHVTPLMLAVERQHPQVVEVLLEDEKIDIREAAIEELKLLSLTIDHKWESVAIILLRKIKAIKSEDLQELINEAHRGGLQTIEELLIGMVGCEEET